MFCGSVSCDRVITSPPTRRNISMTPAANTKSTAYIRFGIVEVVDSKSKMKHDNVKTGEGSETPELRSEASGWVMRLQK